MANLLGPGAASLDLATVRWSATAGLAATGAQITDPPRGAAFLFPSRRAGLRIACLPGDEARNPGPRGTRGQAAPQGEGLREEAPPPAGRVVRVVALPAPSDREKTQLYTQRYLTHFPAAGEVVIFDRSWYNRAGVEEVLGLCTRAQHDRFLEVCPLWEQQIVQGGVRLLKYWLEVGAEEQKRRFRARIDDPLRQWKLSPTDLESRRRWYQYSEARDQMLAATDTRFAPWHIVRSDDKKRARLNCLTHLL